MGYGRQYKHMKKCNKLGHGMGDAFRPYRDYPTISDHRKSVALIFWRRKASTIRALLNCKWNAYAFQHINLMMMLFMNIAKTPNSENISKKLCTLKKKNTVCIYSKAFLYFNIFIFQQRDFKAVAWALTIAVPVDSSEPMANLALGALLVFNGRICAALMFVFVWEHLIILHTN